MKLLLLVCMLFGMLSVALLPPHADAQQAAASVFVPLSASAAQPAASPVNIAGQVCPQWVHDRQVVAGPDGKSYPTWHPTIDPQTNCFFDHEHGDDPRTSVMFREVGMPPFGYVNAVEGKRVEDHVGNKVYVVNDDGRGGSLLVKLHQGSHSPDAFTNNLHELHYHYRNRDGRRLDVRILASFGRSGEITTGCGAAGGTKVTTAAPTNNFTSGARVIPSAECYALPNIPYEDWLSGNRIVTPQGRELAYFDPHFAIFNPSRYFAPGKAESLGRSVDRCRELRGMVSGECDYTRNTPSVAWNSANSPFKGEKREMYVNQNYVTNSGGTTWYCDAYGRNASTQPFPGAIKQYISTSNYKQTFESRVFGRDNNHAGPGVRAPN